MASTDSSIYQEALAAFHTCLQAAPRVVVLSGAGLSSASGLPTFRGAGGMWRNHVSQDLATPEAFRRDPALVWRFYSYRRHMSLEAKPNAAHYALAEMARKCPGFIHLSQNVDGLSQLAQHPEQQLKLLHGTLFEVKCSKRCGYKAANFEDPIVPSLALPADNSDPTSNESRRKRELDISDASVHIPDIPIAELPTCPQCKSLTRPGVVWFGEHLPEKVLDEIDSYFSLGEVNLLMVIGTSAQVYPAAGYIQRARAHGAKVCVVNMDENAEGLEPGDFKFVGDAAKIVPALLEPIIGDLETKDWKAQAHH